MKNIVLWVALCATTAITGATLAYDGSSSQTSQDSGSETTRSAQQSALGQMDTALQTQAQQTIMDFKQKDPSLDAFFRKSAGYAVFPEVGEGALIVGGARGKGVVYQNGKPIGQTTVTKATVGAQVGGQTYSELIFFETPQALQEFKSGNYKFSAAMSAVLSQSGAAKSANYTQGVAVFTAPKGGAMAQAAVGGQTFAFQPLAGSTTGSTAAGVGGESAGAANTNSGTNDGSPK